MSALGRGHRRRAAGRRRRAFGRGRAILVCQWRLLRDAKRAIIVPPPQGAVVSTPPPSCSVVYVGTSSRIDCGGAFYAPVSNGYQVIPPPIGATVTSLPDGAVAENIKDTAYFRFGDAYYRPFYSGSMRDLRSGGQTGINAFRHVLLMFARRGMGLVSALGLERTFARSCPPNHARSPDWTMAERANWGYAVAAIGRYAAMRQLLAALIVPSIVGLVTYFVVRLLLGRDENGAIEGHTKSGFEWAKVTDPSPT